MDREVYEKPLEMRRFLVSPHPEEADLASSWAAGASSLDLRPFRPLSAELPRRLDLVVAALGRTRPYLHEGRRGHERHALVINQIRRPESAIDFAGSDLQDGHAAAVRRLVGGQVRHTTIRIV